MRVALDTNILVYAEGVNGDRMRRSATRLLRSIPRQSTLVPVQSLGELFNVLVKKAGRTRRIARARVLNWRNSFTLIETSPAVLLSAADLAADHGFGIWDAIIVSAGAAAGCTILLSEDLQDGFTWQGLTIANPFLPTRHPLLDALLGTGEIE
jgi:predicted nucleic acid-binding protein